MMYPLIMILIAVGIIIFLFVNILPKITGILTSFNVPLPLATRFVMWLSQFMQENWLMIVIGTCAFLFVFDRWTSTKKGKKIWHRVLLKIPVIGDVVRKVAISRFTKTLSTLIASGVPIVKALDIVKNVVTNVVIQDVIVKAKEWVVEGKPLAKPLIDSGEFPPLVTHMIQTGEKTGDLENMLMHVSASYDNEVQHKISSMTSILEPVMIVAMAGIVALCVVAILIPMFDIFSSIR